MLRSERCGERMRNLIDKDILVQPASRWLRETTPNIESTIFSVTPKRSLPNFWYFLTKQLKIYLNNFCLFLFLNIFMKLRYGYIQDVMKKCNKNKLHASFKMTSRQVSIFWSTFNFDFTFKPLQKVCLKTS